MRTALITGGARGIGFACAERLAGAGHRVAILDIDPERARAAAASLAGGPHIGIGGDVTNRADVQAVVERVSRELEAPTLLINNAGILRDTPFLEIDDREWQEVLDVSLRGAFLCMQTCVPAMVDADFGRVVNISSTAGKSVSTLGGVHYTTAKTALLGLTRATAKELAPHGVTVNAVCPGLFATQMTLATVSAETLQRYADWFPIKRLGRPDEVAAAVAYLCSEDAAYVTGAALDVNGGDLMV
jgi:3-oxoacyl-[acyl-carrier protein] reductase